MPKGWRDWFRRVSEKKARDWESSDLNLKPILDTLTVWNGDK